MPATSSEFWWSWALERVLLTKGCEDVGAGTKSGLIPSKRAVPERATVVLRMKPGALLSRRYHRVGLDRARVRESWRVECHGMRRFRWLISMLLQTKRKRQYSQWQKLGRKRLPRS